MVKKNLFKKITALSLSLCLAAAPTMAYAGEFSAPGDEVIMMDDASEGGALAVEEETVDFEDATVIEDAASEDEGLVAEDLTWNDDIVIEDNSAEEEVFGVDEDTMAILQGDVIEDDVVAEEAGYTSYTGVEVELEAGAAGKKLEDILSLAGFPNVQAGTVTFSGLTSGTKSGPFLYTSSSPVLDGTIKADATYTASTYSVNITITNTTTSGSTSTSDTYSIPLKVNYNAQIGSTYYKDLDAAKSTAEDATVDTTVRVLADFETSGLNITNGAGKEITIDLNGKTVKNTGSNATLTINSPITITDSVGGGKITNDTTSAISFGAATTLTIGSTSSRDFTIEGKAKAVGEATSANKSTVKMLSGAVTATTGDAFSGIDELTISGGTVTANDTEGNAITECAKVTVSGGTLASRKDTIEMTNGELTVSGGTLTSIYGYGIYLADSDSNIVKATLSSGVTLSGDKVNVDTLVNASSVIKVANALNLIGDSKVSIPAGTAWVQNKVDAANSTLESLLTTATAKTRAKKDFLSDDVIRLGKDVKLDATLEFETSATLDLMGKKLTNASGVKPTVLVSSTNSALTIQDSVGKGELTNDVDDAVAISDGKLTIKSGILSGPAGAGVYVTGGTTTISGGTVKGATGVIVDSKSTSGTVTISGGEVTGTDNGVLTNGGTTTIEGGTIKGTNGSAVCVLDETAITADGVATVEIKGGTYTGATKLTVGDDTYKNFKAVKVYNKAIDITDTAEVIVPAANLWVGSDSLYELSTLQEAVEKTATGGTIKLTKSFTLTDTLEVANNTTIDLCGNTITNATVSPTIKVAGSGNLTIIDSEGGGSVTNGAASAKETGSELNGVAISIGAKGAALTVGSSTSSNNNFDIQGVDAAIESTKAGSVTILGGTFDYTSSAEKAHGIVFTAGTLSVKDGDFDDEIFIDNTDKKVTSAEIKGGKHGNVRSENLNGFIKGGIYHESPAATYLASGYTVITNPDYETYSNYPYKVVNTAPTYKVTLSYTPTAASTAPTSNPTDLTDLATGTAVAVTANAANTGYTFDGWYNGTTKLSSSTSYTYNVGTSDVTLTAVYTKTLTATVKDATVVLGAAYAPTKSTDALTVTGLEGSDTATAVLDVSGMTLAASTYNKDTAKIGDTFPITCTGLKIKTSNSTVPKYNIASTAENGTLTVIKSATAEEFVAAVGKLPAASAVTSDNLAATRTAINAAKAQYDGLTAGEKANADVVAAKKTLDDLDTAVAKMEADKTAADAVKAQIDALPTADKATSADKANADAAKAAYDALTDDQKKLISAADKKKLDDVKAAADKAAEDDKKAADAVSTEVNALPALTAITLDDKAAIEKARKDYDALTPAQQALIPDAKTKLEAAEEVLKALEGDDQKKADEVSALISALPSPDDAKSSDRAQVDAAKAAYNALTPAQQALVTPANKNKLNDVDKAVKAKEDQAAADEVEDLIEAIKDAPAGEQKAAAQEARAAYYGLTTDQRDLLPESALDDLEEAEAAFEEGRIFGLNGQRYKVLSNGDVTYHRPQDKETVESVNIPNQVKKGGYLFKVVKVSINAFNACPNLKWVVVGKNVKSLGKCAFKNTPKLSKVKFMGTQVTTATSAFTGAGSGSGKSKGANMTIFTKASVVDEYESLFKGAGKLNAKATVTEMA